MTIHRKRLSFESTFTQIPNAWLRDASISQQARGLLTQLLSHRPGWKIKQADLITEHEGKHVVRKMVNELRDAGYLEVRQGRNGNRFGTVDYDLCDPHNCG